VIVVMTIVAAIVIVNIVIVIVVIVVVDRVYDSYVLPPHRITDYCTAFSGISADTLTGVTKTLQQVQQELLQSYVDEKTVLCGHSLESDLRALRLVHVSLVDTAVLYPHRKGPPYRRSLRELAQAYLHKNIQVSE